MEIGNDGIKDTSYQYDQNSRLLLQEETQGDEVAKYLFDYDANGNQVEKNKLFYSEGKLIFSESSSFRFDGLNQLRETITAEGIRVNYSYNGNGLRAGKDVDGEITNFTYDLGNIILETDENGMSKAKNFFGRQLVSRQTADDVYYYLFNGHGDVVQLTDELGDIIKDYRYDPFGREMDDQLPLMPGKPTVSLWRSEVEKLDNPFQYAGEYRDQETGLYYLRARYYDPQIQRFISEDSFAKHPYWQQHVYAYCGYNPVNFIDPSGYGYVWNRFGEIIGTTEGNDYTDYSKKATDTHGGTPEIVNRPWDGDSNARIISATVNGYLSTAINKAVNNSVISSLTSRIRNDLSSGSNNDFIISILNYIRGSYNPKKDSSKISHRNLLNSGNILKLETLEYSYSYEKQFIPVMYAMSIGDMYQSAKDGGGQVFNKDNWSKSYDFAKENFPKGAEMYFKEKIGSKEYDTLFNRTWDGIDDIKAGGNAIKNYLTPPQITIFKFF